MNPSHSSLQASLESVPPINPGPRNPSGVIRTCHRPRPTPMATPLRGMRPNHNRPPINHQLTIALHPHPVTSSIARRQDDRPRPQTVRQPAPYLRPGLSPVSPVFNYLDAAFRSYAERIQSELTNLRTTCSKAIFKEQQEKEQWRNAAHVQAQLARRLSARQHEMRQATAEKMGHSSTLTPPPASAPASVVSLPPFRPDPLPKVPAPPPSDEPPASADVDSDSEESAVQSLVYPSPQNSPLTSVFSNPVRYQRCRSLPADYHYSELRLSKLSPRSQLFPPGTLALTAAPTSPPLVADPFIDGLIEPTYAEPLSRSPGSVTGLRRVSNAGSEASTSSTCIDSDDEPANIPISRRHRSASTNSGSSAEAPAESPVEEVSPISAKSEPEDTPPVPVAADLPPLFHVDLMYISKSDQWHCRACLLSKSRSPSTSAAMSFPLDASWDILRDHCAKEHPKESADVAALPPAELYALRLKLYQHQQSMGMF